MSANAWRNKREKIWERDDYSCVYCSYSGSTDDVEDLMLDRVIPRNARRSEIYDDKEYGISRFDIIFHYSINGDSNLVTACYLCSEERRQRPLRKFFQLKPGAKENFLKKAIHIDKRILEALIS